jgi:uncharacterized protein YbaR (Trm112 family)
MNDRPASTVDPKLLEILVCPMTKGALEYDSAKLARGEARLSDPRRHPDHAARGSAPSGLTDAHTSSVMAGLVPAIHVFVTLHEVGEARMKPGRMQSGETR